MKSFLPKLVGIMMKMVVLVFFLSIKSNFDGHEYEVININNDRTVQFEHQYINYETIEQINYNLPLFTNHVIFPGELGVKGFVSSNGNEEIIIKEPKAKVIEVGKGKLDFFIGTMTGYGPDCLGCSGRVACSPYQNVKNGNIYYNDAEYGKIRIVAADRNIPCGTVVEISNHKLSQDPIIAIVLDRGGVIKGNIMDLLYNSEAETKKVGRQRNIRYDILRWGRQK